jgi:hypothetical protein
MGFVFDSISVNAYWSILLIIYGLLAVVGLEPLMH